MESFMVGRQLEFKIRLQEFKIYGQVYFFVIVMDIKFSFIVPSKIY